MGDINLSSSSGFGVMSAYGVFEKAKRLMSAVLLGGFLFAGIAYAAAPVGQTIWLHNAIDTGSYVTMDPANGNWLASKNVAVVDTNETFLIEQVPGTTNILIKSVANNLYVRVDTADVKKLKAVATDTSDSLTQFQWTDLPGGMVQLTSIGNGSHVSPAGVALVLRANLSTPSSLTEFTWDVVDGTGAIQPPTGLSVTQNDPALDLDWDDSNAGSLFASFRVYRSLESGTNYTAMASNLVVSVYSDASVSLETPYYYVVTAVDTNGTESGFSSEVVGMLTAGPSPIQHLDATIASSVTNNPVTQWNDQSGFNNHAVDAAGSVYYPSESLSGSDLAGLDFGVANNSMELFSAAGSESWLDFTGSASANSGFSVLMALKVDGFIDNWNDVLGNSTTANTGFLFRLGSGGDMKTWLGAATLEGQGYLESRDTVVLAVNYNASTGLYEFWNSKDNASVSDTVAATNFSLATPVTIGRTTATGRYIDGMIGEVKVYNQVLSSTDFASETAAMVDKWVSVKNIKTPEGLTAIGDDEWVSLDWLDDISGDLFASYSVYRSTISGSGYAEIATGLVDSEYIDEGMPGGITYYYVVTAIDTNGIESAFSNEVSIEPNEVVRLQHLDASVVDSLLLSGVVVTQWIDQTSASNNAVPAEGDVLYPSSSLTSSGAEGIDLQHTRNSLELFSAVSSDSWLDQSAGTDGFCVLVAFKCDQVNGADKNDVIGNSSTAGSGFGMRYDESGAIKAWLGGEQITSIGRPVEDGETLVFAFNYDAGLETYSFWDSKNCTDATGTLAKADFSLGNAVTLGSITSSTRYLDGMVVEVKIFGSGLNDSTFRRERFALLNKWTKRPNIVMIYVDDWAWNGTPIRMDDRMQNSSMLPSFIEMPNLQAMAANGMRFRNAYGSPQCSPARAALQTGQSNPHNGFTVTLSTDAYYDDPDSKFPVLSNGADQTLDPDAFTIPEALGERGYASAHIGKWHLYGDPTDEGYYAPDGATDNKQGQTTDLRTLDGITDPKLMGHITTTGLDFIEEKVAAGQPFYVQMSHYAMHEGRECFPSSRARFQNIPEIVAYNGGETDPAVISRRADPAVWLGMGYELDLKIGEVHQKLNELGIADNTYVIVVSDNGYREDFFNEVSGLSQPLHAHKWMLWQGGIRVPMIVSGPGIPANSLCTANVVNYDFMPTFYEWVGGDPAALQDIDGVSLASVMEGELPSDALQNRSLYFHYPHYRDNLPHSVIVKGLEKVVYFYETPVRFPSWEPIMYFDLASDAGEYHNIYPENAARAQELYADMTNFFAQVGARMPLVPNPAYDSAVYEADDRYDYRVLRGPFIGTRVPEEDEWFTSFTDYWMDSWLEDGIGAKTNDFDGDGIDNMGEYALGGDPTDPLDGGAAPLFGVDGETVTYIHGRRNDDSDLGYSLLTTTNLVDGPWIPVNPDTIETNSLGGGVEEVSNSIPLGEDRSFYQLKITSP